MPEKQPLEKKLKDYLGATCVSAHADEVDRDVAFTIRIGGRKSKIGNKHNWDGYYIDGKEYYLTSKDCLQLMGFNEQDHAKLTAAGVSEARILKVAGNSIVVSVLEAIFKELFYGHSRN